MKTYRHKTTGKLATKGVLYYTIEGEPTQLPEWMVENSCDWEEILPDIPEYVRCIKSIGYCIVGKIFKTRPRSYAFEWFYDSHNSKDLPDFCDGGERNWDWSGVVIGDFFAPATKEQYDAQYMDYEILAFTHSCTLPGHYSTLRSNGRYRYDLFDDDEEGATLEDMLGPHFTDCKIHSVRRLCDGEVFTVGDQLDPGKIIELVLDDKNIIVKGTTNEYGWYINLKEIKKQKKPLFVTEDGVNAYPDSEIWCVYTDNWRLIGTADLKINTTQHPIPFYKYFSTKDKALEYIDENKPIFSKNDLSDFICGTPSAKNRIFKMLNKTY